MLEKYEPRSTRLVSNCDWQCVSLLRKTPWNSPVFFHATFCTARFFFWTTADRKWMRKTKNWKWINLPVQALQLQLHCLRANSQRTHMRSTTMSIKEPDKPWEQQHNKTVGIAYCQFHCPNIFLPLKRRAFRLVWTDKIKQKVIKRSQNCASWKNFGHIRAFVSRLQRRGVQGKRHNHSPDIGIKYWRA